MIINDSARKIRKAKGSYDESCGSFLRHTFNISTYQWSLGMLRIQNISVGLTRCLYYLTSGG